MSLTPDPNQGYNRQVTLKWVRLQQIELEDLGPFVGRHVLKLPETGLVLVKGLVTETGDGSGSGKSSLLNGIAHLFGGCPFPATELQSWYTEKSPRAKGVLATADGPVEVERYKGLAVRTGEKKHRGRAAEAALDDVFGMDERLRALVTYRGQGQPGVFLAMSDPEKKEFLGRLLGLDAYERVAVTAAERARQLKDEVTRREVAVEVAASQRDQAVGAAAGGQQGRRAEDLRAEAAEKEGVARALAAEAGEAARAAEEAREGAARVEAEATSGLRKRIDEVHHRPEAADLLDARARLRQAREDLKAAQKRNDARRDDHWRLKVAAGDELKAVKAAARPLERLEQELAAAGARYKALKANTCSTCQRPWDDPAQQAELVKAHAEGVAAKKARDAARDAEAKLPAALATYNAVGEYVPDPAVAAAEGGVAELEARIGRLEAEHGQAKGRELSDLQLKLADAQAAGGPLRLKAAKLKAAAEELRNKSEVHARLARSLLEDAARAEAAEAVAEERRQAVARAETALEAAQAAQAAAEAALAVELDVGALVGREGFQAYYFDDALAEVAAAANDILGRVANVRHLTLEFEMEKEGKAGGVTKRITPVISARGRRVSMEAGLSGGMKAAVNLAVDLAVGQVATKRAAGAYPGWLVLDEAFDGLGRVSKESCMEMLAACAGDRLILIVDHSSEFQGLFDRVVTVENVDGRARLV